MQSEESVLTERYRAALQGYLADGESEGGRLLAYECGRWALAHGLGLLDVVSIHDQAMLSSVLGTLLRDDALRISGAGQEFLHESLGPFELVQRGYSEANGRLRELNALLEQRVAERTEALALAARRVEALNEFARALSSTLDLDSIFRIILQQVPGLMQCDWCSVTRYDDAEGLGRIIGVWEADGSDPGDDDRFTARVSVPLSGLLLEGPYVLQDTRRARAEWARRLGRAGIRTLMAVPIVIDGAVWGALNVGFSGARQANLDRVEFMKVMGSHLAAGVHNAELHARLRAAYEDLQRTQEQVIQQERLRALGQMASGIAHDFNNALAPIIGFGELLLDEPAARGDARRVNEYLEIMVSSAQDAAAVVARLRDFYRPREGQMLAAIDVAEIVEQAVLLTRPRWEAQTQAEGAAVRVKTTLRSVPMIAGDPVELREALTNLIFNAVDALPEGGEILIEACPQGDEVVCRVADNGVGMTEEVRQRCLEPFFTTKGDKGSGLGLAMVYGIAQRWGARIEIDSAVGRGTTITLYLPVRLVGDTAREPPPESAAGAYSVLIADDDARVLDFVAEVLRRVGHQVVACHNGREAYQSFCEGQFDVVVTDRGMPEINGDQLAAMIKRRSPRTPVVLFTGFGDLLGDERDRPPGVDAVLPKPVRVALLREVVAELGARSRGGGVGSA